VIFLLSSICMCIYAQSLALNTTGTYVIGKGPCVTGLWFPFVYAWPLWSQFESSLGSLFGLVYDWTT
jgi:hypothetical protein